MENSFGKIVSILILAVMLFIVPLKYYMEKNQALQEMYVSTKTIELVDSARNTGFITKDMYDQYMADITRMNKIYRIRLEHTIYAVNKENQTREKYEVTDIESELYKSGIYKFKVEDYFKIQVIQIPDNRMISYYGGYIKNEVY